MGTQLGSVRYGVHPISELCPIPLPSLMAITGRYPWMTRKRPLVALGAATVGFTIALYLLDPQVQGCGGASISDFEFAGSSSRAAQIVSASAP